MEMKKVILLMTMVLLCTLGFGQVSWDAHVGGNLSNFSKGDLQMKWGMKVGVGASHSFCELFALRSGLYFSMKGASVSDKKFGFNPDKTFKLSYLELLPVLAAFRLPVSSRFAFVLSGGPYLAYQVNKRLILGAEKVRRFDSGVQAGLDFEFGKYLVGVEAQYGLSRLYGASGAPHNVNYSLTCGYRFK